MAMLVHEFIKSSISMKSKRTITITQRKQKLVALATVQTPHHKDGLNPREKKKLQTIPNPAKEKSWNASNVCCLL